MVKRGGVGRRGFTLLELLVVSVSMTIVGGAVARWYSMNVESSAQIAQEARWHDESRAAFGWLRAELRQAETVECTGLAGGEGGRLVMERGARPALVAEVVSRDGVATLVAGSGAPEEARTLLRWVHSWRCDDDGRTLELAVELRRELGDWTAQGSHRTRVFVREAQRGGER